MLIYIYSRKSLNTSTGKSIENQIRICKEYIFNNLKDVKDEDIIIYEDEGFSGGNTNRPQFQKMILDSKKQKPDCIICYRLDRISRSVIDFSSFVEDLNSRGISFISVRESFDTSNPMGRAMMYISSVFAQLERETIVERIKDNMIMLARTGIWLGGITPTGFSSQRVTNVMLDGKVKKYSYLEPNKDLDTIKLIFEKFLEYGSTRYVAQYLATRGIKSVKGLDYVDSTIKTILQNPVYCTADKDSFKYFVQRNANVCFTERDLSKGLGIMPFNRRNCSRCTLNSESEWVIALGKHKGVISGKDWAAVQNIFTKCGSMGSTYCKHGLLSGVIKCGNCGSNMIMKTDSRRGGEPYSYYVCRKKDRLGVKLCNMKNINSKETDNQVIDYIMNFDINKIKKNLNIGKYSRKTNKFQDKVLDCECEIEKLQAKKNNLFKYLERDDGDSFFKDVKSRINYINAQIDKLLARKSDFSHQYKLAETEKSDVEQILKNLTSFKEKFCTLDFDSKKSLLRLVVETITWSGSELKIFLTGEPLIS